MRKGKNYIKLFISAMLLIWGLVSIENSILSGIIIFIDALIINPLFQDIFERNGRKIQRKVYIPIVFLLAIAGEVIFVLSK